ncbi:pilus (MSHA type) biogenesis protein MshL [Aliidiomarina halalkaliphila]|uniref:Pilus (MSHA type) biogenesis protein MshL n=1 Tax=Aliidiomarina halalkaliphila TaxID=2593535 RepID=A0A552X681_9GAMM|nr:pilus (MSHA type) biogenesis protein MshL [Aliidiomarina halalkaliphila]TRW50469.1 pilus (MSHA type) biogenesis protein MshL [Aliidiomarina halalkaliphila]
MRKSGRYLQKAVIAITSSMLLMGCLSKPDEQLVREAEDALRTGTQASDDRRATSLPDDVRGNLRQPLTTRASSSILEEPRFSIQARQVPAADFFAQLTNESPYSLVVHPDVQGSITVNLRDVTLQEALDVVQDIYGFDVRREGRIYRVFPAGLRTETMTLNYLLLTREGMSQTSITSGGVAAQGGQGGVQGTRGQGGAQGGTAGSFGQPGGAQGGVGGQQGGIMGQTGSTISSRSETDFWKDLERTLSGIIGDGGGRSVVVSPQAGLATIRAYPHELRAARDFLQSAERSLQRQVILEARIVEVQLNESYQQGVDWTRITNAIGGGTSQFSFSGMSMDRSSLGGAVGFQFETANFNGMLELLSTQGTVQVLSNPRVTATNNQKAVIKIGEDEYFVTDVSTTTITGTATTSTPNIQLTPFFSGIALDVTPQISDDGTITLHIRPSVTETREQEKVVTLNRDSFVLPLARSNIRESDTVIRARDGEVVVIGGLMQTSYQDESSQVPVLGSIPGLGELFKNRRQREVKKELVIMLRPTIVGVDTWDNELETSRDLLRRWYNSN